MDAKRNAADRGAGLEEGADGIAAIWTVGFRGETLDSLAGMRTVDPLVAVHPQAELKMEAARGGLVADVAQRSQVAVALSIGELRYSHAVPRDRKEEWIRE